MANMPMETKPYSRFLPAENLSGLPYSHKCKYGAYSDLSSYAVILPGKCIYTVI